MPVQVCPTLGSSHYPIRSRSEVFLHKAICNFYGEDKGEEVGHDVCVELLSVPTQGPAGPQGRSLGCWETAVCSGSTAVLEYPCARSLDVEVVVIT